MEYLNLYYAKYKQAQKHSDKAELSGKNNDLMVGQAQEAVLQKRRNKGEVGEEDDEEDEEEEEEDQDEQEEDNEEQDEDQEMKDEDLAKESNGRDTQNPERKSKPKNGVKGDSKAKPPKK